MFPSMEIFLMRVPSELAAGDGQLLLGGVAMPCPVGSPERFRQGGLGRWPQVRAPGFTPPRNSP